MQLSHVKPRSLRPASSSRCVRVHAHRSPFSKVGQVLAAGLVAGSLLFGQPVFAAQPIVVEPGLDREFAVESQKQQLEYLMEQQALARKAQLAQQRQIIQSQVNTVETQLQAKIIEQKAASVQAEKQGNARLASQIAAQEEELEQKAEQVRKAAAKIGDKLDRVEMLQRAKLIAEKQALQRESLAVKEQLIEQEDTYLFPIDSSIK